MNQRQRITAWATAIGIEICEWIEAVESATCATENRAQFKEALLRMLDCDGLVVYDLDRFFRHTEEGLRIARTQFLSQGKTLISLNQNVDISTEEGWLAFTMFLALAEYEARKFARRAKQGKEGKARAGGYAGGRPPYGWIKQGSTLVMCPFQQKVRDLILRWRVGGHSYATIATRLNFMAVPTQTGKQHWQATTIAQIADKPKKLIDWYSSNGDRTKAS